MRAPWKNLASVSVAASLAAAALFQLGCESESERADQQVRQAMAQAATADGDAVGAAGKAAAIQGASPAVSVQALTNVARAEVDRAVDLMEDVEHDQARAAALVGEINRIAGRIASTNTLVLGYARFDPATAKAAIETEKKAAAEGGENGLWKAHESDVGGAIPARATLDKQITDLKGRASQLESQISDLKSKRAKAIADAEKLERQADTLAGKDSVEVFQQSAGARKAAMDHATQIAQLESELMPVRQDLARAEATRQDVDGAVARFDELAQQTSAGGEQAQASIAELRHLARAVVGAWRRRGGPGHRVGCGPRRRAPADAPADPPVEPAARRTARAWSASPCRPRCRARPAEGRPADAAPAEAALR